MTKLSDGLPLNKIHGDRMLPCSKNTFDFAKNYLPCFLKQLLVPEVATLAID